MPKIPLFIEPRRLGCPCCFSDMVELLGVDSCNRDHVGVLVGCQSCGFTHTLMFSCDHETGVSMRWVNDNPPGRHFDRFRRWMKGAVNA